MDQSHSKSSTRIAFVEMAQCLRTRNQRYLDFLKQSGDPADLRSKVLAMILDSAADGLVVLDDKLTIVLANLAAAQMAGWQLEDVTRDELRRQYHFFVDEGQTKLPYDQEPIVVAMRERRAHEMVGYVVSEHLPPPGRWVRVNAAPLFDDQDQVLGGVSVFTDITDRMKLQRQRDCLAALITHDIKNHLAAEQMFLDDLQSSQRMSSEDYQMAAEQKAAGKKFMQIADSLLEIFRTDLFGDKLTIQASDLNSIINEAVALSALEAGNRRVGIEVQCNKGNTTVHAFPDIVRHVIHNLIQNAIEASSPDSVVRVCVSPTSQFVTAQVIDTGTGMSDSQVSLLFRPPGAAGKPSKSTNSKGFGMYLSHLLIEGQGGS
ncbi:MAG: PAS domain-containing sensor histidine kinase, partial [Terriglobales bacterium]